MLTYSISYYKIKINLLVVINYIFIVPIELPKAVKEYKENSKNELLQWMMFLDNPENKEVTQIMLENKDIKEAKEELEKISQDDILRRRALSRTLDIADRIQFEEDAKNAKKALEEGLKKAKEEANKKLKVAEEEAKKAAKKAAKEAAKEAVKEEKSKIIIEMRKVNISIE